MDAFSKQSWFLGEMTVDDAINVMKERVQMKTFVVYKNLENNAYIFAFKSIDSNIEMREIKCCESKYQISGETNMFNDAIEAVKSYAASQYLTPAFGGAVDDQNGNNATHPSYQQAITLQPGVVPLKEAELIASPEGVSRNSTQENSQSLHNGQRPSRRTCTPNCCGDSCEECLRNSGIACCVLFSMVIMPCCRCFCIH